MKLTEEAARQPRLTCWLTALVISLTCRLTALVTSATGFHLIFTAALKAMLINCAMYQFMQHLYFTCL